MNYPKQLHKLNNDLPFLTEKIKIKRQKDLVGNLHGKKDHAVHKKL